MIKIYLLLSLFVLSVTITHSQCVDSEKVTWGGDYDFHSYIYFCPAYQFSYDGDTSTTWSILDPVNIKQIEKKIMPIKKLVESQIKNYAGDSFFSRIRFHSVEVDYPDSVAKFAGRQPPVIRGKCKAKYYFYYQFFPDSLARYHIGIATNEKGIIISNFNFPSKKDYKLIDNTLNVCKVLEIAKKSNKNISPIDHVKFDYNKQTKRFYWIVTQEIVDSKEGENIFNQVVIDAADSKKVKNEMGKAYITY